MIKERKISLDTWGLFGDCLDRRAEKWEDKKLWKKEKNDRIENCGRKEKWKDRKYFIYFFLFVWLGVEK